MPPATDRDTERARAIVVGEQRPRISRRLLELVRARGLAAAALAGCAAAAALAAGAASWAWVGEAAVWLGVALQLLAAWVWVQGEFGDGSAALVPGPYAVSWVLVLGGFLLQHGLLFRLLEAAAAIDLAALAPALPALLAVAGAVLWLRVSDWRKRRAR